MVIMVAWFDGKPQRQVWLFVLLSVAAVHGFAVVFVVSCCAQLGVYETTTATPRTTSIKKWIYILPTNLAIL